MIDWKECALAARRANSAYLETEAEAKAAFAVLGDLYISRYVDGSHQVVISVDERGNPWVSISGTRFSEGKILDVLADVSLDPVNLSSGGSVTKGAYEGMDKVWEWALSIVPAGVDINVCGHSLGAARTHLTPLFVKNIGALYSFESPKFVDKDYYVKYAEPLSKMVCVLNGADLWAGWPWFDSRWSRPLNPHIWLTDGWYSVIKADQWPGGKSNADHDMDSVQAKIDAIAVHPLTPECAALAAS